MTLARVRTRGDLCTLPKLEDCEMGHAFGATVERPWPPARIPELVRKAHASSYGHPKADLREATLAVVDDKRGISVPGCPLRESCGNVGNIGEDWRKRSSLNQEDDVPAIGGEERREMNEI